MYYEAPESIVLIDPLVPPERERFLAKLDQDVEHLGLPVLILLTVPWHERSAAELAERYGARRGDAPAGIVGLPFPQVEETVYWLPAHRALVPGDTLFGAGDGGVTLCPDTYLGPEGIAALRVSLLPLLELPVERILVTHGDPVLRDGLAALERALRA